MSVIHTQVIRDEPHAEIGALIERDAEAIVQRWLARTMAEQPSAQRSHYAVLRDHMPKFLRVMGGALTRAGAAGMNEHCLPALDHGEQRWEHGWSLGELVRDYQLLQLVILEYLELSLSRPLRYREMMAVGVYIHDAVAASIATYVAQRDAEMVRLEKERTEALEQAARGKDEFMAMLAHELRNPLAPISNSVQIARKVLGEAPAAVATAIDVIERQTSQLVRLVEDILDVARIGLGRFELRLSRLDLASVLTEAVQASEPLVRAKNHALSLSLPSTRVELEADRERLVQIVCNLINNAAKYTPPGGRIELAGASEGEHVVIRVRDNGIGIAAETIPRIFDMFMQADGSRDYGMDGLGIGLTLVRRLVEQHDGIVECFSEGAGKGSEFVVRLPAAPMPLGGSLRIVERPARKAP